MRILMAMLLAAGLSGQALAHEIGGELEVVHRLLSLHHLPALILLVIVLSLFYRSRFGGRRATRNGPGRRRRSDCNR